jgi:hypothetical protein
LILKSGSVQELLLSERGDQTEDRISFCISWISIPFKKFVYSRPRENGTSALCPMAFAKATGLHRIWCDEAI